MPAQKTAQRTGSLFKKESMSHKAMLMALASLMLSACASAPPQQAEMPPVLVESRTTGTAPVPGTGGYLAGDGPGTDIPANIDNIPDAVPKNEPLHRYANRPYIALGKTYTPITAPGKFRERGIASWYGKKFHGQRTSIGETYDMYAMTAAHPTLPVPSYARVTNTANNKSVVVRINDRGPFLHNRVIDLSYTAAHKLGIVGNGSSEVLIESLSANAGTIARSSVVESRPLEKSPPARDNEISTANMTKTLGSNVYLQLGAFKSQDAAESFLSKMRTELGDIGKQFKVFMKDGLVRVHLGPYTSQSEARSSAEGLKDRLGFKPMLNLH